MGDWKRVLNVNNIHSLYRPLISTGPQIQVQVGWSRNLTDHWLYRQRRCLQSWAKYFKEHFGWTTAIAKLLFMAAGGTIKGVSPSSKIEFIRDAGLLKRHKSTEGFRLAAAFSKTLVEDFRWSWWTFRGQSSKRSKPERCYETALYVKGDK